MLPGKGLAKTKQLDNNYRIYAKSSAMARQTFPNLHRRPPSPEDPVTVNLRQGAADMEIPWHSHPWGQFAYPVAGTIRLSTEDTAWIVPPYRAIWIPAGVVHHLVTLGEVELRTLYVDGAKSPLPEKTCKVVAVSHLLGALSEALVTTPPPEEPRRTMIQTLLLEELRQAQPLALGLPMPRDRRLKALCDALLENPATERPLADWAAQVGASPRTLNRLFQSELGMSFGLWRQQLRLSRAATLVAQNLPLAQIANELGYASPSAFTAMFKRAFGVPPSQFFRSQP